MSCAPAGVKMANDLHEAWVLQQHALLPHGAVHQLQHALVEVVHKLGQVLLVGVRTQTLTTNPVYFKFPGYANILLLLL